MEASWTNLVYAPSAEQIWTAGWPNTFVGGQTGKKPRRERQDITLGGDWTITEESESR